MRVIPVTNRLRASAAVSQYTVVAGSGPFQENYRRSILVAGDAFQVVVLNINPVKAHLAGPFLRWKLAGGVLWAAVFHEDRYLLEAYLEVRAFADLVSNESKVFYECRNAFVIADALRSVELRFIL